MPRTAPRPFLDPETKLGKPTDYTPDLAVVAYRALESGKVTTIPQLAELFGVSKYTVYVWRQRFPEFFNALRDGRYDHDSKKVVRALYERATGYEYTETTIEGIVLVEKGEQLHLEQTSKGDKDGGTTKKLIPGFKQKTVTKKIQPDVMAIMFWLQNRQPEEWKNVQKQEVVGTVHHDHDHKHELDLRKLGRGKLEALRQLVIEAECEEAKALPPHAEG